MNCSKRPTGSPNPGERRWISQLTSVLAITLAVVTSPALTAGSDTSEPLARDVVARADRIRFPDKGFQVEVTITTSSPDSTPETRAYRIMSKGNDKTLVQTTAPAIDRDQILLMREHDLWAFLPSLSQPIRLSLSQRLTGQVANGDLARANFIGDYITLHIYFRIRSISCN